MCNHCGKKKVEEKVSEFSAAKDVRAQGPSKAENPDVGGGCLKVLTVVVGTVALGVALLGASFLYGREAVYKKWRETSVAGQKSPVAPNSAAQALIYKMSP